ncbi:MAG TPA: hypothetical protein DCE42_09620 [Myxococcales bacterium]|nr:hypothetical protein [Deltaproteobacteria bacterium]HAA55005.1 hypothetical protein [Myxococcales bacterium]
MPFFSRTCVCLTAILFIGCGVSSEDLQREIALYCTNNPDKCKGSQGAQGPQGTAGKDGKNGQDGASCSVDRTLTNAEGDTEIVFKCGTQYSQVVVKKGEKGDTGVSGNDAPSKIRFECSTKVNHVVGSTGGEKTVTCPAEWFVTGGGFTEDVGDKYATRSHPRDNGWYCRWTPTVPTTKVFTCYAICCRAWTDG